MLAPPRFNRSTHSTIPQTLVAKEEKMIPKKHLAGLAFWTV